MISLPGRQWRQKIPRFPQRTQPLVIKNKKKAAEDPMYKDKLSRQASKANSEDSQKPMKPVYKETLKMGKHPTHED